MFQAEIVTSKKLFWAKLNRTSTTPAQHTDYVHAHMIIIFSGFLGGTLPQSINCPKCCRYCNLLKQLKEVLFCASIQPNALHAR